MNGNAIKNLSFAIISLKPTAMFKLYFLLLIVFIVACKANSNNTNDSVDSTAITTNTGKSFTWADEDEKEFLAGCVENAKAKLSDTAAYAQCKCVLEQLKKVFPTMDSAANALTDSTTAALYINKCK
jgi:hypothetical protein